MNELEKKIDWIARELRSEIKFNRSDLRLASEIVELCDTINLYNIAVDLIDDQQRLEYIVRYLINSLKREFNEPEVYTDPTIDGNPKAFYVRDASID